jgi:hypothetical protein
MELKERYRTLVKTLKGAALSAVLKLRNEDIAKKMGYNPNYFSTLTGGSGVVTQQHIDDLQNYFKDELAGVVKPSLPGDPLNRERAIIQVLLQRVAKLEADRLGIPVEKVLSELEQDTMIAWKDLENKQR